MPRIARLISGIGPVVWINAAFFALALVLWPIMAELELFERFHDFSRAHEAQEIDELAVLGLNLTVALLLSVIAQAMQLRRSLRRIEAERLRADRTARHDALTGLMNRHAIVEELATWSGDDQDSRIVAVIDLDRFKPVNDLHGHGAGDKVLKTVAERLPEEVDAFGKVGRLGGDEFALVLNARVTTTEAERLVRRILMAVDRPIRFRELEINVGASVGLAEWHSGEPGTYAMERADKALMQAKNNGRGQFAWYDAELDARSRWRTQLETDLRFAIVRKEVRPWFQPIVNLKTRRLSGVEVLARWTHPGGQMISPDTFIPIAEDSGQIAELGWSLLDQACREARQWEPKMSLSFNVSPRQFQREGLLEKLSNILGATAFDPARLIIEVTEGSIIQDMDTARTILLGMKGLGISVALDDFGTGFSSLAALQRLPFDRLKIDRSFVTGLCDSRENQRIVDSIIALSRGLGLKVTAEGIETPSDLAHLLALECDQGQGFLFGKPASPEETAWMMETVWSGGEIAWPEVSCPCGSALAGTRKAG